MERTPEKPDAGTTQDTPSARQAKRKAAYERRNELRRLTAETAIRRRQAEKGLKAVDRYRPNADTISVVLYLDTNDENLIDPSCRNLDAFLKVLGYKITNSATKRGSFFRQSWAKLRQGMTSDEAKELTAKAQRALELQLLDRKQAEVDSLEADALSRLVDSVRDVPNACFRTGSILFIKYTGPDGPVLMSRNLSQVEILALEKFPEIQTKPQELLERLALAVSQFDVHDITAPQP